MMPPAITMSTMTKRESLGLDKKHETDAADDGDGLFENGFYYAHDAVFYLGDIGGDAAHEVAFALAGVVGYGQID